MERIGKYVIHKLALTTGYAQVVFCHDPDLMVPVAVKLFDPRRLEGGPLSPAQLLERFVTEARVMALVDHPCVVPVKCLEHLPDGRPYFVMPYLAAHLPFEMGRDDPNPELPEADRPRRLPLPRAVALTKQLSAGLAVLHRRGMVHRSVKPSNILLTARENGMARLSDFSTVKLSDRTLPMPDHWMGAVDYCAPEQRENATSVGPQADVYSVGVLLYRMVTGRLPDPAQGAAVLPEAAGDDPLAQLIRRATDPDPQARPAHAGLLLPLLDGVLARRPPPPPVQVVSAQRRAVSAAAD